MKLDRHSPDALTEEEQESGLILACRSRPLTDVAVRWLSDETPAVMHKHDAVVGRVERVARDVVQLNVQLCRDQPFPFRSGQFAKLRFGRLPARSYSMASQPGARELEFHIRVRAEGRVSSYVADELRAGDPVEVRGPFGEAYWEGGLDGAARSSHLLLLAGGTGMAPILSVLDAALSEGHDPRAIDVYHGVRTPADLYSERALIRRSRDHGFRFVPVFADGGPGRIGQLHEAVRDDFPDLRRSLIHVAGPPAMVDAVRDVATRRRAHPQRIRADAFHASEPEKRSLWERITAWGTL